MARAGLRPIYPRPDDDPGAPLPVEPERLDDGDDGDDGDELPYRCTVQDVADLLLARTKDDDGNELGEFTDATRPTDEGVDRLITRALAEVLARVGGEPAEPFWLALRTLVALYAAMLVELSYFPEQVRSDRSAYPEYERLFTAGLKELIDAIRGGAPGGHQTYSVPIYTEITAGGRGDFWPYGAWGDFTLDDYAAMVPRNPNLRRFPPSIWPRSPEQRP
jgi:hypothetical protein